MKNFDGSYIRCNVSGKVCYSEKEAGSVINSCKKHYYSSRQKTHKKTFSKKSIPQRKYYCKDCNYFHLTHIKNPI